MQIQLLQGVHLSNHTRPLHDFSADAKENPESPISVGFIDVEGSGDKTGHYDLVLVTPILMASKVVFFNWMGMWWMGGLAALHVAAPASQAQFCQRGILLVALY
jgi:hypothetical protein